MPVTACQLLVSPCRPTCQARTHAHTHGRERARGGARVGCTWDVRAQSSHAGAKNGQAGPGAGIRPSSLDTAWLSAKSPCMQHLASPPSHLQQQAQPICRLGCPTLPSYGPTCRLQACRTFMPPHPTRPAPQPHPCWPPSPAPSCTVPVAPRGRTWGSGCGSWTPTCPGAAATCWRRPLRQRRGRPA